MDDKQLALAPSAKMAVLDPATYVAGVFAEHRTKLDALKEADKAITYDIQTTAGLALAKSSRMSAVRVRTGIEEQRKYFKAPLLAAGKQLDEVAKALTAEIQPLEDRHGVAIVAEEQRLEAIRAAKAEEERQRLAALEAKVQAIRTLPDAALMLGSEQIAGMLDELRARVLTLDEFAELTGLALATQSAAIWRLTQLHEAALAREAEALRLEEERQELQRLREAQALRDKQEAEAREAELAAARLRQAEEAERQREHRASLEADMAAQRAKLEADIAAERARQQAERDKLEAEQAAAREQQRLAQEKLAAEQAEFQRQREELQAQIDAMDREPDPVDDVGSTEFVEIQPSDSAPAINLPGDAFACLGQWAAAERDNDAIGLAIARRHRDAILAVLVDF